MQIYLYKLRKGNNISQRDMAKIIGKSTTTYRDKELGKQDFKLNEMFLIANYFNKDIGDIFTLSTSQKVK